MMVNGSLSEATWLEKITGLNDVRSHFSSQFVYDMDSSSLRACKAAIKVEQRVRIHNNNNNDDLFCSLLQTSLCYKVCDATELLRPNQCSKAESCQWSELLAAKVQGLLQGAGRFWVLMLKYTFSHILGTLFISFLTASSTPKTDRRVWPRFQARVQDWVWARVWARGWARVQARVLARVWAWVQARIQVWVQARVWAKVQARVWASIWARVWARVWDWIWARVWPWVWTRVWAWVQARVWPWVWDRV